MKFNKLLISLLLVFLLLIQHSPSMKAQPNEINSYNFHLLVSSEDSLGQLYANYIQGTLNQLNVTVSVEIQSTGAFNASLYHKTDSQAWDLAISAFNHDTKYPTFGWLYNSNTTGVATSIYQLNNSEWQSYMMSDIGISFSEVNQLIDSIDNTSNILTRYNSTQKFAQLYMDKLLFDLPLTSTINQSQNTGSNSNVVVGPHVLIFNVLNENLRERNIRYSIASAIDKTELEKISNFTEKPDDSPVWLNYNQSIPPEFIGASQDGTNLTWYKPFPIPYDLQAARDLLWIKTGSEEPFETFPSENPGQVSNVATSIPGVLIFQFTSTMVIVLLGIPIIFRKKRRDLEI